MIQQGFPSQTAPFVTADGRVQQVWYQLLISLFQRTGGPQGVNATTLVQQVQAAQTAASDAGFLGIEEGKFAALEVAAATAAQDVGYFNGDDGRLNAVVQQASVDPGALVLLLGDAR